jgi:hypothetical protein
VSPPPSLSLFFSYLLHLAIFFISSMSIETGAVRGAGLGSSFVSTNAACETN